MSPAIIILSVLATIVATVLAYIYIIPEKKRAGLNNFGKFLHDLLNFKFLIIEKILQFFYVLANAFALCFGFFMLFYVEERWSYYGGSSKEWRGWIGLLIIILAPIAIRLTYELAMMGIMLVKNVIQINNKLKNQNEAGSGDPFAQEVPEYVQAMAPKAPENKFCINCGAALENGHCPNCQQ